MRSWRDPRKEQDDKSLTIMIRISPLVHSALDTSVSPALTLIIADLRLDGCTIVVVAVVCEMRLAGHEISLCRHSSRRHIFETCSAE